MDRVHERISARGADRLGAVAGLVCPGSRVADVGTGHGRLPLRLLRSSRVASCIAVERTPATGRGLDDLGGVSGLEIRYGDGLRALRPEDRVDVLVMSGLGARTMIRILEQDDRRIRSLRRLVLQPQTESGSIRRWLLRHGAGIVAERMVRDRGRFYVVVAAEPGASPRFDEHPSLDTADLLEAGPLLVNSGDPLVAEFWQRDLRRIRRILSGAPAGPGRPALQRRHDLATSVLAALHPR